jgi:hypothetical protein
MGRVAAAAFAALILAGGAGATIVPQRSMSGIALGMTPAQVHARLGRPVGKAPGRWHYARQWVAFRGRRVVAITIFHSSERTRNGIGLGSSERQVRAAFPNAVCTAVLRFRRCRLGSGAPGTPVTDFMLVAGRVAEVTIQRLA